MRITTMMNYTNAINSLNKSANTIRKYENQLFTGKKVNTASDDPISMTSILNNRRELGNITQYSKNIATVKSTLNTAEGALTQLSDLLSRCKELVTQGSNGTYNDEAREAIAQEIRELKDQAGLLANTKYGDYYLFGGVDTKTPPYNRETQQWQANKAADRPLNIEVSLNTHININMDGEGIFNGGGVAGNLFDLMDNIVNDLVTGNVNSLSDVRIEELDAAITQVTNSLSKIGSTLNRLDIIDEKNTELELNAKEDLSNKEDADIDELYISLTTARAVYQAGLSVTAKILQTSLIDYLR